MSTYEYESAVNMELLQNLRSAAQETGGRLCNNSVDPGGCVRSAEEDISDSYLLTYVTHSRQTQPEWRKIKVTVERPNATVLARAGVLIGSHADPAQEKRRQIQAALLAPIEFSALRISESLRPPQRSRPTATVSLVMGWDAQRPPVWSEAGANLTIAGTVTQGLRVVQRFGEDIHGALSEKEERNLLQNRLAWSKQISLPTGNGTLRIVVRDNNSGRLCQ